MYFLTASTEAIRDSLLLELKNESIHAVFHYQSLHNSQFNQNVRDNVPILPNADRFSTTLFRLPFHTGLTDLQVDRVVQVLMQLEHM